MDWQKYADEMIAAHPIGEGYSDPDELRRACENGGPEPVIVDSHIADTVGHVHDSLATWRRNCAELLALPGNIEPRFKQIKRYGVGAFEPKVIEHLRGALECELAKAS